MRRKILIIIVKIKFIAEVAVVRVRVCARIISNWLNYDCEACEKRN